MRHLNLSNRESFPMVHFYTLDRMINTYTSEIIKAGYTFVRDGHLCTVTSVKEEKLSATYEALFNPGTVFYYVKYEVNPKVININPE